MTCRILAILALVCSISATARAQFLVLDNANLAQTILIAERTYQHYDQLRREFEIVRRMARALSSLDQYRIPTIPIAMHDTARWEYGRPWIDALNSGDATGDAYRSTVLPLLRLLPPSDLSAAARQAVERQYATIEITDSVANMGGHQVALARKYQQRLQDAIESLQEDVLSRALGHRQMTAILDKIAAGELLARRQDVLANQLLSHALEQLVARSKRQRDTEAATMDMQLVTWRDGRAANEAFVAGTGDALRSWRQP
jgi:hypothetical protein